MAETAGVPVQVNSEIVTLKNLGTKCPKCGQKFSEEGLHIAVFLYGIFFLIGRENGYAGITCPSCLNTICHADTVERTLRIKELMSDWIQLGDSTIRPHLRYFSSIGASPEDIPAIGAFDTHCMSFQRVQNGNELIISISEQFVDYDAENAFLVENRLCSFIPDEYDPVGTSCYVWWFKESDVDKLLKIENSKGIKVFPRYYHRCSLIEKVDSFCWKNYLVQKNLDDLKNEAAVNLEKFEQAANYLGIDEELLLESNPGTLTPSVAEFIIQTTKRLDSTEVVNIAGDFFDILVSDPDPWDFPGSESSICKGFWKTKNPFIGTHFIHSISKFDPRPYDSKKDNEKITEMKKIILEKFREKYVQDYLHQEYTSFITNFINCAKSYTFSYSELWDLKDKHLQNLNEIVLKETRLKDKDKFYRKDGFWILSFQGKTNRLKYLKGFAYMQFLVSKKNKDYSYIELHNLLDREGQKVVDNEVAIDHNELHVTVGHTKPKERNISYKRLKRDQRIRTKINEAIVEATELGNEKRVDRLKAGLSKREDDYKKFLPKKDGRAKTYENVYAYKTKKDKIDRDIKYALKYLKAIDEKAWQHFRFSIKNGLGRIGYESEGPDWFTG